MPYQRYALYYAPSASDPLSAFAAQWFGWDPERRQEIDRLAVPGLPELDCEIITATPRRYGFHATLKPPFRLIDGHDEQELINAVSMITCDLAPVPLGPLRLCVLRNFLALVPENPGSDLPMLGKCLVQDLDDFRKPPEPAELAKRRAKGLTDRQNQMLDTWGYPYVFDEFRFHLTLTGALDEPDQSRVKAVLSPILSPLLDRDYAITDLCLFGDPGGGACFHLVKRFPLVGSAPIPD